MNNVISEKYTILYITTNYLPTTVIARSLTEGDPSVASRPILGLSTRQTCPSNCSVGVWHICTHHHQLSPQLLLVSCPAFDTSPQMPQSPSLLNLCCCSWLSRSPGLCMSRSIYYCFVPSSSVLSAVTGEQENHFHRRRGQAPVDGLLEGYTGQCELECPAVEVECSW